MTVEAEQADALTDGTSDADAVIDRELEIEEPEQADALTDGASEADAAIDE